jgi:hypothetical protein
MGRSLVAAANPKIWLDSSLPIRTVGNLFTGNVTAVWRGVKGIDFRIVWKKLTIGTEKSAEPDS